MWRRLETSLIAGRDMIPQHVGAKKRRTTSLASSVALEDIERKSETLVAHPILSDGLPDLGARTWIEERYQEPAITRTFVVRGTNRPSTELEVSEDVCQHCDSRKAMGICTCPVAELVRSMAPILRSEVDDAFWERLQQSLVNARDHTRKRKRATSPQREEEPVQVPGGLRLPVVRQSDSTIKEETEKVKSRTESLPVKAAPCAAKARPSTKRASSGSPPGGKISNICLPDGKRRRICRCS